MLCRARFSKLLLCLPIVFSAWLSVSGTAHAENGPPFVLPTRPEVLKIRSAALYTDQGTIYFELYPEHAPWHVANFKYLADKNFYRNVPFHLFMPDYIIQAGVPPRNAAGIAPYSLPPEFSILHHERGTLGMARKPNERNPERRSSGTQFHILLRDASHMDGAYTIFGKIINGLDVLDRLKKGSIIRELKVFVREEAPPSEHY